MMSVPDMMTWLQDLPFSKAVAESTWLFPGLETLHVLAITMVVGSVAMMDLRLLGVGRGRPLSQIINGALPWVWAAFTVAVIAGGLLFCSKALTYYENIPFRIKMVCMAVAGANMLVFHRITAQGMSQWDTGLPPASARMAGAFSLALWVVIVATGRWIGFTT